MLRNPKVRSIPPAIFVLTLAAFSTLGIFSCAGTHETAETLRFYAGSSDGNLSHSIFLCELDPSKGSFSIADSFAGVKAGSYLALSPKGRYLYAINQEPWNQEPENATVTSFRIEPGTLALEVLNSQSSKGSGICHIYCSKKGDYLFAANYGSGHASAFPLRAKGEIAQASSVVVGEGSGPVAGRQQGPHAHQVMLDPAEEFLLVPDLGTDRVLIYAFDPSGGTLTPNPAQAFFQLAPGAGPRHLAFHPDGLSLFIVNELNSTLTACRYNGTNGTITETNTLSTVDASHKGMKYPAAVRVHPNGKFVYASTRGENSCLSVFKVHNDRTVERIQVVEHVPAWPREFNVDPSGRFLLVAGERSDEIRIYTIDPLSGLLTASEGSLKLPAPACILFVQK